MNHEALVCGWLAGLGDSARLKYSQALRDFTKWAFGMEAATPADTMRLLVEVGRQEAHRLASGWRDHLLAMGRAEGTVSGLVSGIASLLTAARFGGLVEWPMERVAPRARKRQDRRGPPRQQIEQLLAHLDELAAAGDARAARDVAIVRLLHNGALRRNEVVTLDLEHVHLEHADGPMVYAKRKGLRERQGMTIGRRAAESLANWLRIRGDHAGPVFFRLQGAVEPADARPLTGEAVRLMLRQRAKEAGCQAPFRPHGLRHAAATFVARSASSVDLRKLGGWVTRGPMDDYVDNKTPTTDPVAMVEI